MINKLAIFLSIIFLVGCGNMIRTSSAYTRGDTEVTNQALRNIAADKETLTKYLNSNKRIFPNEKYLPGPNDIETKKWTPPVVLKLDSALYEAGMENQQGTVTIATLLSESGQVIISMIIDSTNDKLNNSATASVTTWKFAPATLDGKPCKSVIYVPLVFKSFATSNSAESLVSSASILGAVSYKNQKLLYPTESKQLKEQGKVVLKILVNSKGQAEKVELTESSGFARLDQAAINAVSTWQFTPKTKDGITESSWALIPITFKLD